MRIERITTSPDRLGESPVWDAVGQRLFWVDSLAGKVRAWDYACGTVRDWQVPAPIGCMAVALDEHVVIGVERGMALLMLRTGALKPLASLGDDICDVRMNDGRTDRDGRMLAGTLFVGEPHQRGALLALRPDGVLEPVVSGIAISNALCFSPDGNTMYLTDSTSPLLWAFDYDRGTGTPSNRRVVLTPEVLGSPADGATVDADGNIWTALITEGKIGCFSPGGELIRTFDSNVAYPSSVSFGGPELDILFFTSIRDSGGHLPDPQDEGSGHVFAVHGLGVRGIPDAPCTVIPG